jgi:hypothetical protein
VGHPGPPISQRPSNSAGSRAVARFAEAEKTKNPPEPQSGHSAARHEQPFDPLELEAGVARPLVELDPRHAFVADSGGSRPGFRDDLAHHSDLMSLAVPR